MSSPASKLKPKSVSDELRLIQSMNSGLLNPADVVEYASNKNTYLHSRFEWDDAKAGREYRLWQARQIISLELTVVEAPSSMPKKMTLEFRPAAAEPVRAFVSLGEDRHKGGGYRSIEEVLSEPSLREQLLEEAKAEMIRFKVKYQRLIELDKVFSAIDEYLNK